jgi:hypothetical protein
MRFWGKGSWIGAMLACALAGPAAIAQDTPQGMPEIDLALVLAVDVSYSMDEDEQRLQRGGYIAALRSPDVLDAIRKGAIGRIALTYVEWAGLGTRQVLVPWQIVEDRASADAFIAKLDESHFTRAHRTSISNGIDFSVEQFASLPAKPMRRVIDVSGDGPNNQGRPVTAARDEALARGIVINGLPILLKRGGYFDIDDLDLYYEDCVIGGLGAFMVPIRERDQFTDATRKKLILEISDAAPNPLIAPAQARALRVSCMAGEQRWNRQMDN